jgi:hypothetical protein
MQTKLTNRSTKLHLIEFRTTGQHMLTKSTRNISMAVEA